jgi:hypothetical protein
MLTERLKRPGPVLRLRVERSKGKWKVVKRLRLAEKTLPPSDELPNPGKSGFWWGFWFEAVDAAGKVLYRQVMDVPRGGVEVFAEDGAIHRIPLEIDEYTTDLLIPDLPEIKSVKLFLEEPERLSAAARAQKGPAPEPIAVFPARENVSPKKDRR